MPLQAPSPFMTQNDARDLAQEPFKGANGYAQEMPALNNFPGLPFLLTRGPAGPPNLPGLFP